MCTCPNNILCFEVLAEWGKAKDINVEMYDMFFSRAFLEHVSGRIATELNHLIHVEKQRVLDEEESTLKAQLLQSTPEVDQIIDEIRFLKNKYNTRYFHFTDESYPPALFRKLSQRIVEEKLDIVWTTHMRFEETLLDEQVWKDAHASGCRYLHFGFESGNQRVLKLMDKATKLDAIETNLRMSSEAGIWNHIMGFFGFPGETREEAEDSKQFVLRNQDHVHSLGFMTYVLGKYSPVAFEPEKYGVSYYKNPEWDLAMDYYFTLKEGLNIQEALDVFEDFERNHHPKWDLRTCVREYVYLYIEHFGSNSLPQLKMHADQRKEHHHTSVGMV